MSRAIHPRPVLPALLGAIALFASTGQLDAQSYTLPFNPDLYQDAMDSTQPIPSDYGTVDGLVTVTSSAHTNFGDNPYASNPGLCYWHETYGNLVGVAFTCARAAGVSEFAFQPAPGHRLFLESLQLGEYFGRVAGEATVKVFSWDYTTELFSASLALGASDHWNVLFSDLVSTQGLRIQYGDSWDYGADNISFRMEPLYPTTTTPEPLSLLLVATGLAGVAAVRRRHA